jgi:hypothetical protein
LNEKINIIEDHLPAGKVPPRDVGSQFVPQDDDAEVEQKGNQ